MVPLLELADSILITVEMRHYGMCELDKMVYQIARLFELDVEFSGEKCRGIALAEMSRARLSTEGLDQKVLSYSRRYT
jgi:hypothetical protein